MPELQHKLPQKTLVSPGQVSVCYHKMSTSRVALPPGIYSIQTTESTPRAVINPSGQGQQLRVDRVNLTDAAQQVSGARPGLIYHLLRIWANCSGSLAEMVL